MSKQVYILVSRILIVKTSYLGYSTEHEFMKAIKKLPPDHDNWGKGRWLINFISYLALSMDAFKII